ncbi:hypothetical protein BKG84_12050 [Mycobacteroides chelonae]|uniref:Uncharacterized protein n=1 Tax=Mycobacteroides chelonae TaxID=1774 RepID=A0A1S1M6Y0_MYCCH|nr:hypothetical protein BKG84_12050 [Mycobacteroides chelonae]
MSITIEPRRHGAGALLNQALAPTERINRIGAGSMIDAAVAKGLRRYWRRSRRKLAVTFELKALPPTRRRKLIRLCASQVLP